MTDYNDPIPAGALPVAVLLEPCVGDSLRHYCTPFGNHYAWGPNGEQLYTDEVDYNDARQWAEER